MKKNLAILLVLAMTLSPVSAFAETTTPSINLFAITPEAANAIIAEAEATVAKKLEDGTTPFYFNNGLEAALKALKKAKDSNRDELAMDVLEKLDKLVSREALAKAINDAQAEADKDGAAPVELKALKTAITAAKKLLTSKTLDADKDEAVDTQTTALTTAVSNLTKANTALAALIAEIERADGINISNFTDSEKVGDFNIKLSAATKAKSNTKTTTDGYTQATTALKNAIDELFKLSTEDKKGLRSSINAVTKYDAVTYSNYTDFALEIRKALDDAQKVYDNTVATQKEISDAKAVLDAFKDKLITRTNDVSAIKAKVRNDANAKKAYFNPSLQNLKDAITAYDNAVGEKDAKAIESAVAAVKAADLALVTKQPLRDAVASATSAKANTTKDPKDPGVYTTALDAAKNAADAILLDEDENVERTASQRDQEVKKVRDAVKDLEDSRIAVTELNAAIKEVDELKKDTTIIIPKALDTALATAKELVSADGLETTTIKQFTAQTKKLKDLSADLQPKEDTDLITEAREALAAKLEDGKTTLYFNKGYDQLKTAVGEFDTAETIEARNKALTNVEKRFAALVSKEPLAEKVAEAEAIDTKDGADRYITELKSAITAAKNILTTGDTPAVNTNETKRDKEVGKLETAIKNFNDSKPLKEKLVALLAQAEAIPNSQRTNALTKAITNARKDNSNINQLTSYATALENALKAILPAVPVVKDALEAIIAEVGELTATDYTNFDTITAPLANANTVNDNAEATQDEVDAAVLELRTAIDNLDNLDEVDEEPNEPTEDSRTLDPQTAGSFKVLAIKGEFDGPATVVIAKGDSTNYSYSTKTSGILLQKGSVAYLISLDIEEVKTMLKDGKSIAETFDAKQLLDTCVFE